MLGFLRDQDLSPGSLYFFKDNTKRKKNFVCLVNGIFAYFPPNAKNDACDWGTNQD